MKTKFILLVFTFVLTSLAGCVQTQTPADAEILARAAIIGTSTAQVQTMVAANARATQQAQATARANDATQQAQQLEATRQAWHMQVTADAYRMQTTATAQALAIVAAQATATAAANAHATEQAWQVTQQAQVYAASTASAQAEIDAAMRQATVAALTVAANNAQADANLKMYGIPAVFAVVVFAVLFTGYVFVKNMSMQWVPEHITRPAIIEPMYASLPERNQPALPAPERFDIAAELDAIAAERAPQLPSLDGQHVLIVGPTGSGKSHTLRYVINNRGGAIYALDPHATPGYWPDHVTVLGGGRDYETIDAELTRFHDVMTARYTKRQQGQTSFDALVIVADEFLSITRQCPNAAQVVQDILNEGRKVAVYFVTAAHSDNVADIGLSSPLRNNFSRVYLSADRLGSCRLQKGDKSAPTYDKPHSIPADITPPDRSAPSPAEISAALEQAKTMSGAFRYLQTRGYWQNYSGLGGQAYADIKRVHDSTTTAETGANARIGA